MLHFLKAVLKVGPVIILDYFLWMRKYARRPEKYPLEIRYKKARKLIIKVCDAFNIKMNIVGKENIPEGVCFYAPNHTGAFDPLPFIYLSEKPIAFLSKIEVQNAPFLGKVIKSISGLSIDRDDIKQSLRSLSKIEEELSTGVKSWVIFPEGTRNKDNKHNLIEFHHGSFRPAKKSGVPIIPVVTYGMYRVSSFKAKEKVFPLYIEFAKPIFKDEYDDLSTQDIAKLVQSKVQQMLTYKARKYDHEFMCENNNKKYDINKIY